jgi:hypothetical protein
MRRINGSFDLRPSLVGSISGSLTACGAPIDTIGFADCLAVLMVGGSFGTGGNAGTLTVKFQEAAAMTGTGTAWTDITDEAISAGSFKFTAISIADATSPIMYMGTKYAKLADGNRKRYIRAHATMAGTDACNPKFAVGVLLGNPDDTLYCVAAASIGTGNSQFFLGR